MISFDLSHGAPRLPLGHESRLGWPVLILGVQDSICFGPCMLGGALVAILVSGLAGFLD
jgi:hypothetical protein